MSTNIKILDDRSDYFFGPIPLWITRRGFIAMIILFVTLLSAAVLIKVPEKKQMTVIVSRGAILAQTDHSTYELISPGQEIHFFLPSYGDLSGRIEKNHFYLSKKEVFLTVRPNRTIAPALIADTVYCQGELTLSNGSLLQKIFAKKHF